MTLYIKHCGKNFEYGLGEANEAEMLDFSKSIVDDLDLDGDPVGIKDTMDDYWEEQYRFIEGLNEYVGKWIRQVRLFKAAPMKATFIDNSEDYFFTFNYTSVLERIYRVPSNHILYIHGGLYPYCDEPNHILKKIYSWTDYIHIVMILYFHKNCISKKSGNFIITVRKTIMLQKKRLKNWNWT